MRGLQKLIIGISTVALATSCAGLFGSGEDFETTLANAKRLRESGAFAEAELELRKARATARSEGDRLREAIAIKETGNLYSPLGYNVPDTAKRHYDDASAILRELVEESGGLDSARRDVLVEWANVLNNQANLEMTRYRFDDAIEKFRETIEIDEATENAQGKAKTLMNLGRAARDKGIVERGLTAREREFQYEESIEYFKEAHALDPNPDCLANMARSYELLGERDSAIVKYGEAASEYAARNNRQWRALCVGNVGVILVEEANNMEIDGMDEEAANAKRAEGLDSLLAALDAFERLRGEIESDVYRSTFFEDKIFYYENAIGAAYDLGDFERAFELTERAKARSFLDLVAARNVGAAADADEETSALIERERRLRKRVAELESDPDAAEALSLALADYEDALDELERKAPEYASLVSVAPAKLEDVQALLDDDAAVLEFFLSKRETFVVGFVVDADGIVAKRSNLANFGLLDSVTALRENFVSFLGVRRSFYSRVKSDERKKKNYNYRPVADSLWATTTTDGSWQYTLLNLYGLLVGKELTEAMADKERIIVVPHGPLHHLPFGALISSPMNLDFAPAAHIPRPTYWIEEKSIVSLPSSSVLPFLKRDEPGGAKSVLAIGNPTYPTPDWNTLKGAEAEADLVAHFFERADVYKNDEATETAFKKIAADYDVLHLATHGQFKQPAMDSRVLFAATDEDDGYLTTAEIFNMKLDARLATLSACQSGQVGGYLKGELPSGDDLVGLTRAFLYAGVSSVVATLWVVDDQATKTAMSLFYSGYIEDGLDKSEALRRAQLGILNDEEEIDWRHPFFWAPFALFGDHQ